MRIKSRNKNILIIAVAVLTAAALTLGFAASAFTGANQGFIGGDYASVSPVVSILPQESDYALESLHGNAEEGEVAAPESDIERIATAQEFYAFLQSAKPYGLLTDNITINWSDLRGDTSASNATFVLAEFKTFDGNGYTVTLAPTIGGSGNRKADVKSVNIEGVDYGSDAATRTIGLFVAQNYGTIKNTHFVYAPNDYYTLNATANYSNRVGIICGTNDGIINNISLDINKGFKYMQDEQGGTSTDNSAWTVLMGGVTGYQRASVTDVTVRMAEGVELFAYCDSNPGKSIGIEKTVNARASIGGVVGRLQSVDGRNKAEVRNIIFEALSGAKLTAEVYKGNRGTAYREQAIIVAANSTYSGTEHKLFGTIDNIIYKIPQVQDGLYLDSKPTDSSWGRNSIVHCGEVSNATTFMKELSTSTSRDHLQLDNCGCDANNSGAEHTYNVPNFVYANGVGTFSVGFDADGNQVINANAGGSDAVKTYDDFIYGIGSKKLFSGLNNGSLEIAVDRPETAEYIQILPLDVSYTDGTAQTANFMIPKNEKASFASLYTYEINIDFGSFGAIEVNNENVYTGADIRSQIIVKNKSGANITDYDLLKLYNGDAELTEAMSLPGVYEFDIKASTDSPYAYYDRSERIVVAYSGKYSITITKTNITEISVSGWSNGIDTNISIPNALEGAIDGYSYTINNGLPITVTGIGLKDTQETATRGRTYTITALKGGVEVSETYELTIYVDKTAPTLEITGDTEWTNAATKEFEIITADAISGISEVNMDGTAVVKNSEGKYIVSIIDNDAHQITVTDVAGNTATGSITANVDPDAASALGVIAEIFTDENCTTPYNTSDIATEALYIKVTGTFSNSGGKIYYTVDGGEPKLLTHNVLRVGNTAGAVSVYSFYAVSTTLDSATRKNIVSNAAEARVITNFDIVTVTANDITVGVTDKTYDGTVNYDTANLAFTDEFIAANGDIINGLSFTAAYADANAGNNIVINILVNIADGYDKVVISDITGITGFIAPKDITVTVENKIKEYGEENPMLTAVIDGLIEGDVVNIKLSTNADKFTAADTVCDIIAEQGDGANANYNITAFNKGTLTVTKKIINKIYYDASLINNAVYSGEAIVLAPYFLIDGSTENISVQYYSIVNGVESPIGGAVNAGEYKAVFVLGETIGANFAFADGLDVEYFTIAKAGVQLEFDKIVERAFDGSVYEVPYTISNGDTAGVIIEIYTSNAVIKNAGVYRGTIAYKGSDNYNFVAPQTFTVTINKAILPTLSIQDVTVDYNGTEHAIAFDANVLPDTYDISQIAYRNTKAINAGVYKAIIELNDENYEKAVLNATLTINTIDISGFALEDLTVLYDGEAHGLEISAEGIDLSDYDISYSNNNYVRPGEYEITATIKKVNYNDLILIGKLIIAKHDFEGITLKGISKTYDGESVKLEVAISEGVVLPNDVMVIYSAENVKGMVNAGVYTVTATISAYGYNNLTLTANVIISQIQVDLVVDSDMKGVEGSVTDPVIYYLDKDGNRVNAVISFETNINEEGTHKGSVSIADGNYSIAQRSQMNVEFITVKPTPVAAIAGGVTGGVAGASVIGGAVIFFLKRKVKI